MSYTGSFILLVKLYMGATNTHEMYVHCIFLVTLFIPSVSSGCIKWSSWSVWGECDGDCHHETKTRSRECQELVMENSTLHARNENYVFDGNRSRVGNIYGSDAFSKESGVVNAIGSGTGIIGRNSSSVNTNESEVIFGTENEFHRYDKRKCRSGRCYKKEQQQNMISSIIFACVFLGPGIVIFLVAGIKHINQEQHDTEKKLKRHAKEGSKKGTALIEHALDVPTVKNHKFTSSMRHI